MICFLFLLFLCHTNSEKFCTNCIHYKKPFIGNTLFGKCSVFTKEEEKEKKIDYLVTGKNKVDYLFCTTVRHDENLCGEKGKYYTKKCFLPDMLS